MPSSKHKKPQLPKLELDKAKLYAKTFGTAHGKKVLADLTELANLEIKAMDDPTMLFKQVQRREGFRTLINIVNTKLKIADEGKA